MNSVDFRAATPDESLAVMVSFDVKWLEPLVAGGVQAVIRRRYPKTKQPSWLYAYVNSPVSRVVCRARVDAIKPLTLDEAGNFSSELLLTPGEIERYFERYPIVGLYLLRRSETANPALHLRELRKAGTFWPTQNFLYLSQDGQAFIDSLCGFVSNPVCDDANGR